MFVHCYLGGRISVCFYPKELQEKTNSDLLHFLSFIRPLRCAPLYLHRPSGLVPGQQSPPSAQLDDTHLRLAWLSRSSLQLPSRPYMGEDGEGEGRSFWPGEEVRSRLSFDLDRTDVSVLEWLSALLFPGIMRKSNSVSLHHRNHCSSD